MRSSSPVHGSHETAADLDPYEAKQRELDELQRATQNLTQTLGITTKILFQPTGSKLEPLREPLGEAKTRATMCKNIAKNLIKRRKDEGGLKKLYTFQGERDAYQMRKEHGIILNMCKRFKEAAARGKLNHTRVRTAPCLRLRSPRPHPRHRPTNTVAKQHPRASTRARRALHNRHQLANPTRATPDHSHAQTTRHLSTPPAVPTPRMS